jgi:DNA-binding SARP family transcriptional activator
LIHCKTLGAAELTVDGSPAPRELLWRKNLALLVYLARSPRRRRTREHLRGLLWGSKPEEAARHSLNEAVRVIRRLAGEDVLSSDGEQIAVAPGAVVLDTDELEKRAAEEDWQAAASLVGGVFLEGFGVPDSSDFEDWMAAERAAWLHRSVEVLVSYGEARLACGDSSAASAAAQQALGLDPLSDAALRASMRVAALAGDRAGALSQYQSFETRLSARLRIDPEADTVRLADRIRRERTWRLPKAVEQERPSPKRAPLIGRDSELLSALEALSTSSSDGKSTVLLIEGDAGTGKTRLAEELLSRARLDGSVVIGVRAVPSDRDTPYSGLIALCRAGLIDVPGLVGAPAPALASLAESAGGWRERFSEEIGAASPAPLGQAFSDLLRVAAEEQPLVAFVDDAEWLDRESALALTGALRDLGQLPFALLLAIAPHPRRAELEDLRSHIGGDQPGMTIALGPLEPDGLIALSRWALPEYTREESDRLVRRLQADTAALPLLAVEILNAVRLGLELSDEPSAWPQADRTLDQTLPSELPDSVVAAIRTSFRRLHEPAQRVLAAASVLDERVAAGTLARATGLDEKEVFQGLDELEWHRWMSSDPRGYSFVARVVRLVIARDMLTPGQKERIRKKAPA